MKERLKNNKGFTLVEIIVVLVILAILAAIAVPSVLGYVEQAKESEQLYKVRDALIASQTTLIELWDELELLFCLRSIE